MDSQLSLLYTTFGTHEDARKVSQALLERHLIACANILQEIHSLYLWEGRLEESNEIAVIFKTARDKIPDLMTALQELHPYDTPAMLEIPLNRTNESFTKWVQECVR